jgi:hypothetical protein
MTFTIANVYFAHYATCDVDFFKRIYEKYIDKEFIEFMFLH